MRPYLKKIIAPILVSLILIVYFVFYFTVILSYISGIWKYVLCIVPLLLAALTVKVCIERINEIKKGEKNDLSKY